MNLFAIAGAVPITAPAPDPTVAMTQVGIYVMEVGIGIMIFGLLLAALAWILTPRSRRQSVTLVNNLPTPPNSPPASVPSQTPPNIEAVPLVTSPPKTDVPAETVVAPPIPERVVVERIVDRPTDRVVVYNNHKIGPFVIANGRGRRSGSSCPRRRRPQCGRTRKTKPPTTCDIQPQDNGIGAEPANSNETGPNTIVPGPTKADIVTNPDAGLPASEEEMCKSGPETPG
jgi:hypothetical protein